MPDDTRIDWQYTRNGEIQRPVTWSRLRELVLAGEVVREDLVWHPGMKGWVAAGKHPSLEPLLEQHAMRRAPGKATASPVSEAHGSHRTRPSARHTVFSVQVKDPVSGHTSTAEVLAATADEARAQVQATGMTVGAVLLKTLGTGDALHTHRASPAPPSFAATPSGDVPSTGDCCPRCGNTVIQKGKGLCDAHEHTIFWLGFVAVAVGGLIAGFPFNLFGFLWGFGGIVYYYMTSSRDYCPACRKRVGDRRMESIIGLKRFQR